MSRETKISLLVVAIGVLLLAIRMMLPGGMARQYVREVQKTFVQVERPMKDCEGVTERVWLSAGAPETTAPGVKPVPREAISWNVFEPATQGDFVKGEPGVSYSMMRTFGTWFAAFLTLSIFSFLYRDNPFYKLAESIFIGVSAAYWMVVQFWSVIVPNLLGNLIPELVRAWAMPGLETTEPHLIYLIPLALAVMLLWRLMPSGGWISRWPLAFFIGVFAGMRMIHFLHGDFLNQIRNGIVPLVVTDEAGLNWTEIIWNWISVLGVLACLTYFFFSIEHKGVVGRVARVGTWILMITFGAMFAFTVMGRIALLTGRLEFLFIDWLRLIDPTGALGMATGLTSSMLQNLFALA